MSWRLEPRDLSGQWHLDDSELCSVQEVLQNIKDDGKNLQLEAQFLHALPLSEIAELVSWQGAQWLASQKKNALHRSRTQQMKRNVSKRLTPRLKGVIDLYSPGQANIDLGTDHAHLPILLVRSQKAPLAFGVDIAEAPLKNARQELYKTNMLDGVALLMSNGIDAFINQHQPLQADSDRFFHSFAEETWQFWESLCQSKKVTVTICGVGGALAADLIKSLPAWVSEVIVQANDQEYLVDQAFSANEGDFLSGFYIDRITATVEKKRLFLNKRARRESANTESSSQIYFDIHHALWRWVLLSRASRRVTLTPKNHSSLRSKLNIMQRAVTGFFSLPIR